jgi:hypothetical protein
MDIKEQVLQEVDKLQNLHSVLNLLRIVSMLQTQVTSLYNKYETFDKMKDNDDAVLICMVYEESVRALGPLLNSFNFDKDDAQLNDFIDTVKKVYAQIDPCECPGCKQLFGKD